MRGSKRTWILPLRLLLLIGTLGAWELSGRSIGEPKLGVSALRSSPSAAFDGFVTYARSGLILEDTASTLVAAFGGLTIGCVLGVFLGLTLSLSSTAEAVTAPFLAAVNALPRPALAPVLILFLGLGNLHNIVLAASLVFFPIFYNTLAGVRSVDPSMGLTLRILGASRLQQIRYLVAPSITAWVMAGLPNAVAYSMIGAVLGELIGSTKGLGYRLAIAAGVLDIDRMFAILIWLMLVAAILLQLSTYIERRVLSWRQDAKVFG